MRETRVGCLDSDSKISVKGVESILKSVNMFTMEVPSCLQPAVAIYNLSTLVLVSFCKQNAFQLLCEKLPVPIPLP